MRGRLVLMWARLICKCVIKCMSRLLWRCGELWYRNRLKAYGTAQSMANITPAKSVVPRNYMSIDCYTLSRPLLPSQHLACDRAVSALQLISVRLKFCVTVSWLMTSCTWLPRFLGNASWIQRACVPPKCHSPPLRIHDVVNLKTKTQNIVSTKTLKISGILYSLLLSTDCLSTFNDAVKLQILPKFDKERW
jgi:hypothetical protein